MKLAYLANQIVKAAPPEMLTDQMIYASLDFVGSRNAHLAIPAWHTKEHRTREMQRFEFLTGNEKVEGHVLVFDYCGHDGRMLLWDCDSLAGAESLVLGGGGVFNAFTDLMLVFEHSCLRPYQVSYRDDSGSRMVFYRSHLEGEKWFYDRKIEWLVDSEAT
jgi:hypothetical protein